MKNTTAAAIAILFLVPYVTILALFYSSQITFFQAYVGAELMGAGMLVGVLIGTIFTNSLAISK